MTGTKKIDQLYRQVFILYFDKTTAKHVLTMALAVLYQSCQSSVGCQMHLLQQDFATKVSHVLR